MANGLIAGLPNFPPRSKLATDKKPSARGKSTVRLVDLGLTLHYENRRLVEVWNLKGKKPAVWIVDTSHPGFTVRLYNKPFTVLGWGYRNAERLAIRLAMMGYRKVINR